MHRSLEKPQLFPYVAWTILLSFALFVGHLTLTVAKEITTIEIQTASQTSNL